MANKPLDKGYLLTQFKNFFDKKIKGAFVPSENLTSTTTVVAKDLDVTVKEGSVDILNEYGSIYIDSQQEDVYMYGHSQEQYNTLIDMCSDVTIQTRNKEAVRTEIYMDGDIRITAEVGDAQMKAKDRVTLENISSSPSTDVRYSKVELDYDDGLTLSSNRQVTVSSKGDIDLDADENINLKPAKKACVNDSEIWTESKFPHNLLARYIGGGAGSSYGIQYGLETLSTSKTDFMVPYLYGAFTYVPSSGYTQTYPTVADFVAPYTGNYYLGMFKNDGDAVYVAARRYIDVVLRDLTTNTYTVVISRNTDYDKVGTYIQLTAGHKYGIVLRVYNGFNAPSDNRFHVYPSIYTDYTGEYDYKKYYSVLKVDRAYDGAYRGINQFTDLYDMISVLSSRIESIKNSSASQSRVFCTTDDAYKYHAIQGMIVQYINSSLRLAADEEDLTNLVTIGFSDDESELQLVFLFSTTYYGVRFRLLDYYGGGSSRIRMYSPESGYASWVTLSDKPTGWEQKVFDFGESMDCCFELQLFGAGDYNITGNNEGLSVSVTQIGSY